MANGFQKAVKHEAKLRLSISGPSGAGKTYTALRLAKGLGKKVALIDTERGSASKYADEFDFDVLEIRPPYHPDRFLAAIKDAEEAGYDVCIIDSLSHAWNGPGGVLEIVDQEAAKSKSNNTFTAWKKGTPIQNKFIDGLTGAGIHIIGTMRSKTEYILEQGAHGKTSPKKVGMAPIQRDGFEYEFDVCLEMTPDNDGIVGKTRCSAITGQLFAKPGEELAAILKAWLTGAPARKAEPDTKTIGNAVASAAMFACQVDVEVGGKLVPDKAATVASIKATLAQWHAEDPSCCGLDAQGKPALNACTFEQLQALGARFEQLGKMVTGQVVDIPATAPAKVEAKPDPDRKTYVSGKGFVDNSPPFGATPEAVGQSDPWGEDDEGKWVQGEGEEEFALTGEG